MNKSRSLSPAFILCMCLSAFAQTDTLQRTVKFTDFRYTGPSEFYSVSTRVVAEIVTNLSWFSKVKVIQNPTFEAFMRGTASSAIIPSPTSPDTADYVVDGLIAVDNKEVGSSEYRYNIALKCLDTRTGEVVSSAKQGEFEKSEDNLKPIDAAIRSFATSVTALILKNTPASQDEFNDYFAELERKRDNIRAKARQDIALNFGAAAVVAAGTTALCFVKEKKWYVWTGIVLGIGVTGIGFPLTVADKVRLKRETIEEIDESQRAMEALYRNKFGVPVKRAR